MTADVMIDSVAVRVAGIDRTAASRLGALVAERLAASLALAPGEAVLDHMHVRLDQRPGEDIDTLAGRIAAQVALLIGGTSALEAGR